MCEEGKPVQMNTCSHHQQWFSLQGEDESRNKGRERLSPNKFPCALKLRQVASFSNFNNERH